MKRLFTIISTALVLNTACWIIDAPYFGPVGAPNFFVLVTAMLIIYPPMCCLSLFTSIRPFVPVSEGDAVWVIIWNTVFWSLVALGILIAWQKIRNFMRARVTMTFVKKPYKTGEEFYKAVEQLILMLKENGNTGEASRLDVLLHGMWTTGSELIGELMLSLAEMKGSYPADIRRRIDDCHYFAKHHRRILDLD